MTILWILAGIFGAYVLLLLAAAWISLHPPRTPIYVSPGFMGAPQEEVEIAGPAGRIRAWHVQATNSNATVLMVHGYLMNRAEYAPVAVRLASRGISSLLIDLRAHGASDGRKCTFGLMERHDVAAALRHLRSIRPTDQIGVLGSSMGSAAAALALADDPTVADFLILDSGYSKLSDAISGWWRFLGGPTLQFMLWPVIYIAAPFAGFWPFSVDIGRALGRLGPMPILILHGKADTLALPAQAERNFEHCCGPREIVWFEGAQHAAYRWTQFERYFTELERFLFEQAEQLRCAKNS